MIAVVWELKVDAEHQKAFERFYGVDGEWSALSRRSRSFLGSSFLRDQMQTTRYLLVEYWSEMVVYERHLADFSDQVQALEQRRGELCASISPLGLFTAIDVPDRFGPTWSTRAGR
jgi:quinol monooxygenase YgiN